jgi:heptosyltransferase-2
MMNKVLVIQTAFIGDAILGTALLEKLHQVYPDSRIDYLVRDGNQTLFQDHPFLNEVLIWKKKESKYTELIRVLKEIRSRNYDSVYNIQRYASSGILTGFSRAKHKFGYQNNPLSFIFSKSVEHRFGKGFSAVHEVDRVLDLLTDKTERVNPVIYPSEADESAVKQYTGKDFITIAPASVWFTKQLPVEKWIELINRIPDQIQIYLTGAKSDAKLATKIESKVSRDVVNLAGKLPLLQTAALMKNALMNYANDSAPVHLASAVNAPICEVFCSTVPEFGFTPLATRTVVVETKEKLDCRPCGMHGKSECPKGHYNCANTIDVTAMLSALKLKV